MELKIEKVIINELVKEQHGEPDVFIPDEELNIDHPQLVSVIKALDESFSNRTEKKAKLSEDGFQSSVLWNQHEKFLEFAKQQTIELKKLVKGKPATGGYIVFCLCKKRHRFLSVFIIRNTKSTQLQKQEKNWDVETVTHLDIKNFAMGCRINISLYDEKSDDRYLSFISTKTDIAQYFENWIGVTQERSGTKDANALISIVEQMSPPKNCADTSEFKREIFNYVKSSGRNLINIRDLGKHFYDNEKELVDFAEKNDIDVDSEFKITAKQLSRFYKISVRISGVTLQAPLSEIGKGAMIEIMEDNNCVVIHSTEMIKEIQQQISGADNGE